MSEQIRQETLCAINAEIQALQRQVSVGVGPISSLTAEKIARLEREREWLLAHAPRRTHHQTVPASAN